MSLFNTTREKLYTLVNDFHDTNYSSTEVSFPGRMVTDVEQVQAPFVVVEITMATEDLVLPSRNSVRVSGMLILNHFAKEGSGMKVFTDYSDKLMGYFGLRTLSLITFREVQPYNNKNIEGFDGIMNSVNFDIDYFNI